MIRASPIRRVARVVLVPVAAAALLFMGCAVFQHRLLYLPTRMPLDELETRAEQLGGRLWPNEGGGHRGLLVEPASGFARGTVVVFHGNAGQALDRTYWSDALTRLGWRTILAEYPGYGARAGELGEIAFVADGLETLALVRGAFDGPIVLAGESLGAGVASAVAAADQIGVDGMLLVTPWADLPTLAGEKFPFLPVGLILKDRYDSVANLGGLGVPTAVCIASEDEVIPPHHGQRLFDSLLMPKRCWTFEGCGHNDWPIGADRPWWREAMAFLAPRSTPVE